MSIIYHPPQTELVQACSPEHPRTSDHLVISIPSKPPTFKEITSEEYLAIHHKVRDIYAVKPQGFVLAMQTRRGEFRAEVLPQRSGVKSEKNLLDKVDVNRYILFPEASLTALSSDKEANFKFWEKALLEPPELPVEEDSTGEWELGESHESEAVALVRCHLKELGEAQDASVTLPALEAVDAPSSIHVSKKGACAFCRPEVLKRQTILEHDGVTLMYNMRGGMSFLVLPTRHTQHLSGLTEGEIQAKYEIEQALHKVLTELYPDWNVVIYCQDSPSVGQTVRHSHDQVVAFDPQTIALEWTQLSFSYTTGGPKSVSDDEMAAQVTLFRKLLSNI